LRLPALAVDAAGPDFILKDLKGQEVSLGSFRDRPILLVFGTTWCPYCREEIPRIKEIYRLGREKNLEVLNIFINEPEAKVSAFAAKYALPYRVLLDSDGKVAERYQVRGVPTLVLLDRQGKIVCFQCRNLDAMLKGL
jgi:cytochrome c biogenesis protein CcmG/thiol:disulfide interchange protein DsbE